MPVSGLGFVCTPHAIFRPLTVRLPFHLVKRLHFLCATILALSALRFFKNGPFWCRVDKMPIWDIKCPKVVVEKVREFRKIQSP